LWVPAGELVTFGALTMGVLQRGAVPGTVWMLVGLGVITFVWECVRARRAHRRVNWLRLGGLCVLAPILIAGVVVLAVPLDPPVFVRAVLALLIVAPMAPMIYRTAFAKLTSSTILILLFVAVAIHYALTGLGLVFFGPEGMRTEPFIPGRIDIGLTRVSWHLLLVLGIAVVLTALLYAFFEKTYRGKAMRAVAFNRKGARLVGVDPDSAGTIAFGIAGLIGALTGILIAPLTAIYYDSGFLIGLRGFVGVVLGGLTSFLTAIGGSIFVGLLESYASYFASAFKEAIIFSLLIPILLWRSLLERRRRPLMDEAE
jgi:branched-chain amino acid transport system permease protein